MLPPVQSKVASPIVVNICIVYPGTDVVSVISPPTQEGGLFDTQLPLATVTLDPSSQAEVNDNIPALSPDT